jgi:hypothetical protein
VGWYLKQSFNMGPVRLNLSKSGMGVSVGVPDLRVGRGPKGTYLHAGWSGLYYRRNLPDGHVGPLPAGVEPDRGITWAGVAFVVTLVVGLLILRAVGLSSAGDREHGHGAPPTCSTRQDDQAKQIVTTCYRDGRKVAESIYRWDGQLKKYTLRSGTGAPWLPTWPEPR